jgi:hypothetical protein
MEPAADGREDIVEVQSFFVQTNSYARRPEAVTWPGTPVALFSWQLKSKTHGRRHRGAADSSPNRETQHG